MAGSERIIVHYVFYLAGCHKTAFIHQWQQCFPQIYGWPEQNELVNRPRRRIRYNDRPRPGRDDEMTVSMTCVRVPRAGVSYLLVVFWVKEPGKKRKDDKKKLIGS